MENNDFVREKLIDTTRHVIRRPGMFGVFKVEDIHFLFLGASLLHNDIISGILRDFEIGFRLLVNKYYGCEEGNGYEWYRLIRFHSGDNGFHQIEVFGKLFEAFINNSPEDVMPIAD